MGIPGKLTVRAPDGRRWRVGPRWTPATRSRLRKRNDEAPSGEPADVGKRSDGSSGGSDGASQRSWSDRFDGGGRDGDGWGLSDLFDGDSLVLGLVVAVVLTVAFFLLLPVLEAILVVVLMGGTLVSRVILRRPWRVEARLVDGDSPRTSVHWDVVGYRRSGRVAREVATSISETGRPPSQPEEALPAPALRS